MFAAWWLVALSAVRLLYPIAATRNVACGGGVECTSCKHRPVVLDRPSFTHTHGLWFSLVADYLVRGTVVPITFESPLDRPLPPVAGAFGWDTRKD